MKTVAYLQRYLKGYLPQKLRYQLYLTIVRDKHFDNKQRISLIRNYPIFAIILQLAMYVYNYLLAQLSEMKIVADVPINNPPFIAMIYLSTEVTDTAAQ